MYSVYLRNKKQRISQKFTTDNKHNAEEKFKEIILRENLIEYKLVAIIELKEKIINFHRFDVPENHKNNLKNIQ